MIRYPNSLDNDSTIYRIDDNLSELGSSAINQLREAVFAIEKTLGVNPQGSKSSVNERISVLIGPDGNPRAEALQAIGLVTLPITDNQVANNAGIKEVKLALSFSTASLHTSVVSLESNLEIVQDLLAEENSNFLTHISGGVLLVDNITPARHVASHIDLNAVPVDSRDTYSWTGLLDVNGDVRSATQVAEALLEINNELVGHENATTVLIHPATAISVDTSTFTQLPAYLTNVQEALGFVDNQETLSTGVDRATLNSNGIPRTARIQNLPRDGYTINVVPVTKIHAYLAEPSQLAPHDNISNGDDVIRFLPDNTNFVFDSKFTNVRVGDILRINYGNGIEATYPIMAIRFNAGTDWTVRVNANNLFNADDGYDGYARIDRPNFDRNTWGVFAAAGAPPSANVAPTQLAYDSVIVGSPRGAVAVGIGFDPGKLDANHCMLYLRLYPNGNPSTFYDLPPIDVTGNIGATPGAYSLDSVVEATNVGFRAAGYNYRFIAFAHKGEFGIMLADEYNGAAFTIIAGQLNYATGSWDTGVYLWNVVGDAVETPPYDALGLGYTRSGFATPVMSRGGASVPYPTTIAAANYSTLVITPVSNRNVIINGNRRDSLAKPRFTEGDGYWSATTVGAPSPIFPVGYSITYAIPFNLATEGLAPGKTIVVQPVSSDDTSIDNYGRFIIDAVSFSCTGAGQTNITVLNSIHGTANPAQVPLPAQTPVNIYFSDDSVQFNNGNMAGAEQVDPTAYHHYHEIFVNGLGQSVAVERARIPHVDSGNDTHWRIRRVSPKLKGYRSGVTDFRYFVWLWIDNYNAGTGEFDIYMYNLDGSYSGPITRGKKNHPVKVYDETFVNFIEIEFREDFVAGYPGSPVPSGGNGMFVELFPTPKQNDEYFAVAGVSHSGTAFKSITDLRDFGTISEENFSDSAIKFIQAGERYLHTNGVVRGFKWKTDLNTNAPGYGVNTYTLKFYGGLALVNGAFVAMDAMDVSLPVLTVPYSDVAEYFICVTETGQLKAVLKGGTQFFEGTNDYFVESLTFRDIVDTRKDLTIIAKATVTISTGAVAVTDARRHITNQDIGSYTWAYSDFATLFGGDNSYIDNGNPHNVNFVTPDALMNWVNEYGIEEVKVRDVLIDSKLTLHFTNPVVLKGGSYTINNVQGLSFTSGNWKIDDADIYYLTGTVLGGSFDANDVFNTKYNWGGVLVDLESVLAASISNFGIENSRFISGANQRPPFVGIYSATGESDNQFSNGRFVNNTFTDTFANNDSAGLCYAFVNGNTPDVSSAAPYFLDILVSDTKINRRQGILIAGRATPNPSGSGYSAMNFVRIENFIIKDNRFGLIGYNVENWIGGAPAVEAGRFIIDNNKAELIYSGFAATMHPTDFTFADGTNSSTGQSVAFVVRDNDCNFMKIESSGGANNLRSSITGNTIKLWDTYLRDLFIPDPVPWAMVVQSQGLNPTNVTVSNNTIDGWNGYMHGIYISGAGASVTGNIINNIAAGGYGIWIQGTTLSEQSTIVGNTLNKENGVAIGGYIFSTANSAIYGNTLSHANLAFWSGTVDGYGDLSDSNFNGITGQGATFAAWNVNQVVRTVPNLASAIPLYHLDPGAGVPITSSENNERLLYGSPATSINKGLKKATFTENQGWVWEWNGGGIGSNDGTVGLIIPLSSVLPDRAYLLSLSVTLYFSCDWDVYQATALPTTFPQISLELNGNMVDSKNPFTSNPDWVTGFGSVTLVYQSDALIYGYRPEAPLIKEMVVKMKQGYVGAGSPAYGRWIGPTSSGTQTMRIGQPWITYMY